MNSVDIRQLTDAELEECAGGEWNDPNYKHCWNGPRGAGVYPWYTPCGDGPGSSYGSGDLAKDMAGAFGGIR